jgi:hypothetical protein
MHKPHKQGSIYKGIPFPPWLPDWNSVAEKRWRRRRKKKIDPSLPHPPHLLVLIRHNQ